jgi:hypothetical protein
MSWEKSDAFSRATIRCPTAGPVFFHGQTFYGGIWRPDFVRGAGQNRDTNHVVRARPCVLGKSGGVARHRGRILVHVVVGDPWVSYWLRRRRRRVSFVFWWLLVLVFLKLVE